MTAPLHLRPGDEAQTDYDGVWRKVMIIARNESHFSEHGVVYQCTPMPRNCTVNSWLDAGWFRVPESDGRVAIVGDV